MVKCLSRVVALLATGWMLPASPAFAHHLHVFASADPDGMTIRGSVYFRSGTPARNATLIAHDPAGEEIGRTKTDQQGEFSLEAKYHCDHRLLVDAGEGHGAQFTVKAAELSAALPPRGDAPGSAGRLEAVHAQLVELRKQLNQYEQSLRLRDILGGIGYIVGIAGVAFYLLGMRRKS